MARAEGVAFFTRQCFNLFDGAFKVLQAPSPLTTCFKGYCFNMLSKYRFIFCCVPKVSICCLLALSIPTCKHLKQKHTKAHWHPQKLSPDLEAIFRRLWRVSAITIVILIGNSRCIITPSLSFLPLMDKLQQRNLPRPVSLLLDLTGPMAASVISLPRNALAQ